jgi:hypothetical protein
MEMGVRLIREERRVVEVGGGRVFVGEKEGKAAAWRDLIRAVTLGIE